jgi:hypothetical protein
MDPLDLGRTVSDLMANWVTPEIERRRARGVLPSDFRLEACQVIFPSPLDAGELRVNLNEEVRVELTARTRSPALPGDIVMPDEVEVIDGARLPADEANSGHITLLRLHDNWFLTFDSRYNRGRVREHLAAAQEFLTEADCALSAGRVRTACDLLFSAAELLAKAELLQVPLRGKGLQSHKAITSQANAWVQSGTPGATTVSALNQLSGLRDAARYLKRPLKVSRARLTAMLADLREQATRIETGLSR